MKAKLVQMIEGDFVVTEVEVENLIPAMETRGYSLIGFNANRHQRAELQQQPKFFGVLGPMWDRDCLRYECPETYRALSGD